MKRFHNTFHQNTFYVGILCGLMLVFLSIGSTTAAGTLTEVCPEGGIQQRGGEYTPGGIILTAFDKASMWVYNIDANSRYPLPDTRPCGMNCRLSPDAKWITYVDSISEAYSKMRLNGTERTPLIDYAADIEWWSNDTLLVWTPGKDAYLQAETGGDREYLNVESVAAVQPGGLWGVKVQHDGDNFVRAMVNLAAGDSIDLTAVSMGVDQPYYDAEAWSPNGQWLAYVTPVNAGGDTGVASSEIFGMQPGTTFMPTKWTDLTTSYGPVRINGRTSGDLSWSPDGTHIAFWVMSLNGANPETDAGEAKVHILDVTTGGVKSYCGFTTTEHTPNPPRLIWSPDSTHIAFGGNVPGDDKGYLLLAVDIETGVFTQLSEGLFPTLNGPDPIAWGFAP
ncbi:MAG: PD40 domain-containing protein [Anaerolineae bacterium]|nr:PD40 domain-containing protein [Anaerolineae bacterium]